MVEIIRRKNVDVVSPDVSSGMKATANMVNKIGSGIGSAMESAGKKLEAKEEKESKAYRAEVKQNIKEAQQRMVSEQKAFDAADKMVAADMAGRLKNDLLRWNLKQRQDNPNYIGTAEHEKRMRDEYARLSNVYGKSLGEAGKAEFTSKTQSAVNEFIGNDVKWAYQQKIKAGEESAKQMAETMNKTAGMYGANGDVEGFKESHKESRKNLKDYAEGTGMVGGGTALYEVDKKSLVDFITGMAQTDPVKAKAIMDSMENFKGIVPDEMLQDFSNRKRIAAQEKLSDEIIILNAGIANSKDKKEIKKLTKERDKKKKELDKLGDVDYDEESLKDIHSEVSAVVGKEIEYQLNLQKQQKEDAIAGAKVDNAISFMDNPIIYNAKMGRVDEWLGEENVVKDPEIKEALKKKAQEIFAMSDKVGDGNINPLVLRSIVEQVASITVGDNGKVDDNVLKAFQGEVKLREAGASPEQLQTYHKLAQMAMTDTNFKQSVAALANKPSFDSILFLQNPSRVSGLSFFTKKVKDDDVAFVNNMGRQAYMGAMNLMIQGQPEQALAYYDEKVAQAYDFIKKDIIDVDYVKRELAKTGSAMVELNGNMTKVVGRLPNGEYIIEDTGEKINGGI